VSWLEAAVRGVKPRFFNTESRRQEEFHPLRSGRVALYTCGPTVYSFAHIGNFRAYLFEDLLRRTLELLGFTVEQVMNLTDVDDKTIKGAIREGVSLEAYTEPYKRAFFEDVKTLRLRPADHYPAATSFIPQMIEAIAVLQQRGLAYRGQDGSVYYSIGKFPRYGCLSHLKLEELRAGASERVATDEYDKENVSDFVLWKAYSPERDGAIYWESPFGKGRPGWHLECSVMAMQLLGETIDIHAGGVDNIFPHHENEIAQSEAYSGKQFVRYWLHTEHLVVDGKKMSKSLGNFYTLRDLLHRGYTGAQVRYMLLHTHYRSQLNFTFEELEAVATTIERLNAFVRRLQQVREGRAGPLTDLLPRIAHTFALHLADDLNISAALGVVFDFVRETNVLIDSHSLSYEEAQRSLEFMQVVNSILDVIDFGEAAIPAALLQAVADREAARRAKNWIVADRLRNQILQEGYRVEDTPSGPLLVKQ
jgi:cysteinyl-tRNA synthetase